MSGKRVLVVTGAGISAESGIPTFRGKEGYWRNLDPRQLATATAFHRDPGLVWEWYRERRRLVQGSQPNPAHAAVVQLAAGAKDFLLLTQNVDNLHARAGWHGHRLSPAQLVQIHGDLFVTKCVRCDFVRAETEEDAAGVPVCPRCGSPLRPGVVWFDEELDQSKVEQVEAFLAAGSCDHVLVVGTTATFPYIVDWAVQAKGASGQLTEINPDLSTLTRYADRHISEPAGVSLPRVVAEILGGGGAV